MESNIPPTQNVLLVVMMDTHFVELSRLARLLKGAQGYEPIIWFRYPYATLERDLAVCEAEGWKFELSFPRPGTATSPFPPAASTVSNQAQRPFLIQIARRIIRRLVYGLLSKAKSISGLYSEVNWWLKHNQALAAETQNILEKHKISLLVFAEDNVGYFTHILSRMAYRQGVASVITPYTIANASEAARYFSAYPEYHVKNSRKNWWVSQIFPHWVYSYQGVDLLRMSAPAILGLEISGFRYQRPWVLNSDPLSLVAVENERMLEYYRAEKIPEERLVVTGALYDDVLAKAAEDQDNLRKVLDKELNLKPGQPLILCALPPNQFPWKCEFSNYDELINHWIQAFETIQGWNIVVRPHPRLASKDIARLVEFGVKITTRDTASLVPLSDLYIASVSATIRWAIACGKPVVNYDVYQLHYTDFAEVSGVLTLNESGLFLATLQRLTTNRTYYEQVATAQKLEMKRWGQLDGKASERMLNLFEAAIAGKYHQEKPK